MISKQGILQEIKRVARDNQGVPPGAEKFKSETGIAPATWGEHWLRWSHALVAAGFAPNEFVQRLPDEAFFEPLIAFARQLRKFPTDREVIFHRRTNPLVPSAKVFKRFGGKLGLLSALRTYCEKKGGLEDVVQFCDTARAGERPKAELDAALGSVDAGVLGEVYLVKSGKRYKIGKTTAIARRIGEFAQQLAEPLDLVHRFKTDDPSGIEAYWHRRFADKRKHGEWFELSADDVAAFRRRKKFM